MSFNNYTLNQSISEQITFTFGIILTPVMTIFGLTGNLLAIIVLSQLVSTSRNCNLYRILIALMLADSMILLLNLFGNVLTNMYVFTSLHYFIDWWYIEGYLVTSLWPLMISFQMISVYLTMLISFDRWTAICRAFKKSRMYFTRSTRLCTISIVMIYFVSILYNVPRWWELEICKTKLDRQTCVLDSTFNDSSEYRITFRKSLIGQNFYFRYVYGAALYTITIFITPVVLITYTNIQIICKIRQSHKQRARMTQYHFREIKRSQIPVAIVVMFYLLGLLPLTTSIIESIGSSENGFEHTDSWNMLVSVSNMSVILNSSINIIVYCLVGDRFRQALGHVLKCSRYRGALSVGQSLRGRQGTMIGSPRWSVNDGTGGVRTNSMGGRLSGGDQNVALYNDTNNNNDKSMAHNPVKCQRFCFS